jgi:hypothetical protein
MAGTRMDITQRHSIHEEPRSGNELAPGVPQNPSGV